MTDQIMCMECGWTGYASELLCSDEDANSLKPVKERKFIYCPDCDKTNCFEDFEDDDPTP